LTQDQEHQIMKEQSMKLPTLYKRTTVGKVQTWEIEIEENKFRTITGQQDGAKITNKWTTCKGKNLGKTNETSGIEQALKEAEAKHKKKREGGYSLNLKNIDKKKFYEPMLAQDFKNKNRHAEVDKLLTAHEAGVPAMEVFSQPKLDGIRCIATKDGFFTRNGKEIVAIPHIREELDYFFELNPNAILDGELYSQECKDDFNKITHIVRKQKLTDEHRKESRKYIQYWIYDAPRIGSHNEKVEFRARFNTLEYKFQDAHVAYSNLWDSIVLVETTEITSQKLLDEKYEEYLGQGFEGQMVRVNYGYENKRSANLLKRKEFIDEEYVILGYEEGKGNRSGTVKSFKFKNKDGKDFQSNVKGTFEYLTELLENAETLIGKTATIKYFNLTPDGVPRFPYVIAIRDYE
tara:strand:- start:12701 stop:13915 length:1215 start_codon:yes stop_codon:yes gene_type:complete